MFPCMHLREPTKDLVAASLIVAGRRILFGTTEPALQEVVQPLNALFGCINRICIFEFACGPQTLHVRDVSYEHVVEHPCTC